MKQKIVFLLAFICYWTGIIRLVYFITRKHKRIVTFHNVIPDRLLPEGKTIGITDTEECFRLKIKEIIKFFPVSTDISDVASVTITFDDGYLNQAEVAGRILKEEGNIPAIIFAAGRMINNNHASEALIVDLLLHWTELAPNGRYNINYATCSEPHFWLTQDNRHEIWRRIIWPTYTKDSSTKGFGFFTALNYAYAIDQVLALCHEEYIRLRLTGITTDDVQQLKQDGWIIGWHTQEHFPLAYLSTEEKTEEISTRAPANMKDIVFSYPYGEFSSIDTECMRIAENSGFPCAVSNVPSTNNKMGRFFLPRITLSANKYLLHFELSGLQDLIRSGKNYL